MPHPPAKPLPIPTDRDIARFWTYVNTQGPLFNGSSCWEWTGSTDRGGYGQFKIQRRNTRAHRFSWFLVNGQQPPHLELNHLCSNRKCCNPDHLELVTPLQNIRHGRTGEPNRQKTHCSRGHEYTPENTYVHGPTGNKRHCKTCLYLRGKQYRLEGRAYANRGKRKERAIYEGAHNMASGK